MQTHVTSYSRRAHHFVRSVVLRRLSEYVRLALTFTITPASLLLDAVRLDYITQTLDQFKEKTAGSGERLGMRVRVGNVQLSTPLGDWISVKQAILNNKTKSSYMDELRSQRRTLFQLTYAEALGGEGEDGRGRACKCRVGKQMVCRTNTE